MNTKKMILSAGGCLLLLAAAMAPGVVAHKDNNSNPVSPLAGTASGVAGYWYGPAGYYVEFDGTTQTLPDPVGPVDPDFVSAAGSMLCDMEVLGDGTAPATEDEAKVDGSNGGSAPDSTFNDGGNGGACHTNHYDYDPYNTPGCPAATSNAVNMLLGSQVWIGASCDFGSTEGGTPSSAILETCLVNGILDGIDDQPGEAVDCVLDFVDCTANPITCTSDGIFSCGADGVSDAINFGLGSAPYPSGAKPAPTSGCTDPDDYTAATFVFAAVRVIESGGSVQHFEYPAVAGKVWQT